MKKNTIKITAERPIEYVEMDFEISKSAERIFLNYAKANILKDKEALLNWAIVDILKKSVEYNTLT